MIMPVVDFEPALAPATKAHFDEHGFATIDRITTDEEAAWLRGVYDRILMGRLEEAGARDPGQLSNTLWTSLDRWESFVLQRTALCRNAVRLGALLLDTPPEQLSTRLRFFFKPGGSGRPVPWHQDEAHQDPAFDHHSVNVWVPFDAATVENGCLWYVPGSHRGGIRVHRHPGNGAPEVALMTDDVRACDAVAVPLPAAGATFHHCRTLHASGYNVTGGHRRAFVVICSAPPRRREVPADRPWLHGLETPKTSF